jgi:Type IIA topoisomerase (DNA gyrase/topo II, topoisomerase IV), B subunit
VAKKYEASSITVLEGLEAVRKRPGMYIGDTSRRGLNHLIYEIVDNAVDEHMAGACNKIEVTILPDGFVSITDNGRGIPVDMHPKGVSAERIVFTTLHAGGKFDSETYKTSGGLHGVGSSVVNALSERLDIYVSRDGKVHHDAYEKGVPAVELEKGLLPIVGKTKEHGTRIVFKPDKEIFEKTKFQTEWLKNRLHETAYLNPELTIIYKNERKEAEKEEIIFSEPEGLIAYIKKLNSEAEVLTEPIVFKGESDGIEVEGVIQYIMSFEEKTIAYCNNINTHEGGSHVAGFRSKFTNMVNSYAKELGIIKDKIPNFSGAETRNGMTAIISIKHPDPLFEGQTKTKLGNADATRAVSAVVGEQCTLYFDTHIETMKSIISCAERAVKLRKGQEKAKNNILSKSGIVAFESNGKLASCESRNVRDCELFIVEGDSAGGTAKTARNRRFQAILPLRGKTLNVEKANIDKVLENAEIKTLVHSLGCGFLTGYGNDFDINKLNYNKIIIMTDADVDGAHIDTLLLTLFYRFMPELIEGGHIYLAAPPLYRVEDKNKKAEYLYDDKALEKYRRNAKSSFTIQRYKGLGEMDAKQLWETTLDPERRVLKQVYIDNHMSAQNTVETLMGSNVERRKQFIYENAEYAVVDI